MNELLDTTLDHLRALVGFDTRNPPRAIDEGGIFAYLRTQLHGFECTMTDHGAGVCYMIHEDELQFTVTSKTRFPLERFLQNIFVAADRLMQLSSSQASKL